MKRIAINIQKASTLSSANIFIPVQSRPQRRLEENSFISDCPPDADTLVSVELKLGTYTSNAWARTFFPKNQFFSLPSVSSTPKEYSRAENVRSGGGDLGKYDP